MPTCLNPVLNLKISRKKKGGKNEKVILDVSDMSCINAYKHYWKLHFCEYISECITVEFLCVCVCVCARARLHARVLDTQWEGQSLAATVSPVISSLCPESDCSPPDKDS